MEMHLEYCRNLHATHRAYDDQIAFGASHETAFDFATIVYLQHNPTLPIQDARDIVDTCLCKNGEGLGGLMAAE